MKKEGCERLTGLVTARDNKPVVLEAELEAQWRYTEEAGTQTDALRAEQDGAVQERDALQEEIDGEARRMSEVEWGGRRASFAVRSWRTSCRPSSTRGKIRSGIGKR